MKHAAAATRTMAWHYLLATMLAMTMLILASDAGKAASGDDGVVKVRSAYTFGETISRLKQDIKKKGIKFFSEIDQAKLGEAAHIPLKASTLLLFGNPPLGIQFLTANPNAGLDWPVRLLVTQDAEGKVWTAYTDFRWIARRHGIADRDPQFKMASDVIASITSSIASK
jgi:uncharacterized protein (DUF302 family)